VSAPVHPHWPRSSGRWTAADSGVSVTGLWSGETRDAATSFYLGLGGDADGKAFLTDLQAAITTAKTR
jgi:hypothetical protein